MSFRLTFLSACFKSYELPTFEYSDTTQYTLIKSQQEIM
jgi:hypothetical protein